MENLELQKKAKLLEALVNDLCEETSAEQTYEHLLTLGMDIGITDEDLKDWGFNPFEDEEDVECDGDKRYNVYEYKNLTPKQVREIYRDVTGLSNDYEFTNQEIVDYLLDTLQEKENDD